MKGRVATGRAIGRSVTVAVVMAALSVGLAAQQRGDGRSAPAHPAAPPVMPAPVPVTNAQANVDENFELNIAERRITERDFFASTAIEAGESSAHGLSLRVGVGVGASSIDVLLRNVRGRVRFRGSLEALRRVLDARRPAATTPAPATTPRPRVP